MIVDNLVLGANAVVVKDIDEPGTYVGVPARIICDVGLKRVHSLILFAKV